MRVMHVVRSGIRFTVGAMRVAVGVAVGRMDGNMRPTVGLNNDGAAPFLAANAATVHVCISSDMGVDHDA